MSIRTDAINSAVIGNLSDRNEIHKQTLSDIQRMLRAAEHLSRDEIQRLLDKCSLRLGETDQRRVIDVARIDAKTYPDEIEG